jgi:hypothetical protein
VQWTQQKRARRWPVLGHRPPSRKAMTASRTRVPALVAPPATCYRLVRSLDFAHDCHARLLICLPVSCISEHVMPCYPLPSFAHHCALATRTAYRINTRSSSSAPSTASCQPAALHTRRARGFGRIRPQVLLDADYLSNVELSTLSSSTPLAEATFDGGSSITAHGIAQATIRKDGEGRGRPNSVLACAHVISHCSDLGVGLSAAIGMHWCKFHVYPRMGSLHNGVLRSKDRVQSPWSQSCRAERQTWSSVFVHRSLQPWSRRGPELPGHDCRRSFTALGWQPEA